MLLAGLRLGGAKGMPAIDGAVGWAVVHEGAQIRGRGGLTRAARALLLAACAFAALGAGVASATTYYAGPGSATTTGCTVPATPCAIGYVIGTAAQTGDEVVLLPGSYEVGLAALSTSRAIDIHGQAGEAPPLIEGNTGSNTPLLTLNGGAGTVVSDLQILQHGAGSGLDDFAGGATLERVVVDADAGPQGDAIVLGTGTLLRDSVAWAPGNSAVFMAAAGTARIENVTAYGFTGVFVSGNPAPGGSTVVMENTIAHGGLEDLGEDTMFGSATIQVGYSNYATTSIPNPTGTLTDEGHNQTTQPPAFRAPSIGDFRELPSSPTANGGIIDQYVGTGDVLDAPRTQAGAIDIGAYQLLYPIAITGPATAVGTTVATLTGTVDPEGPALTACTFEYGTTTLYSSSAPCTPAGSAGTSPVAVSAAISGLAPGVPYHFRLVASTGNGSGVGADTTFTTTSPPSTTPVSIAPPSPVTPSSIAGRGVVGSTLTCDPGTWTGAPTFTYSWLRDGSKLAAANGVGHVVAAADPGHALQCQVDATNAGGSAIADSAALLIPVPAPSPSPTLAILSTKASVSHGRVAIALACRRSSGRCSGTLTLKRGRSVVASAQFSIAAGHTARTSLVLGRSALQALANAHPPRLSVTAQAGSVTHAVLLTG